MTRPLIYICCIAQRFVCTQKEFLETHYCGTLCTGPNGNCESYKVGSKVKIFGISKMVLDYWNISADICLVKLAVGSFCLFVNTTISRFHPRIRTFLLVVSSYVTIFIQRRCYSTSQRGFVQQFYLGHFDCNYVLLPLQQNKQRCKLSVGILLISHFLAPDYAVFLWQHS